MKLIDVLYETVIDLYERAPDKSEIVTSKLIDRFKDTHPEWDFSNVKYKFDKRSERYVDNMICHKKDENGIEHGISNDMKYQDIVHFDRACWKCRRQQAKRLSNKFTDDELRDEAKKYNTKSEFIYGSPNHYDAARKRDKQFYQDITSHMVPAGDKTQKIIYAHEFYDSEGKPYAAYIGLTNNSERRYKEHISGVYGEKKITTQVMKFLNDNPNYSHQYKELTDFVDFQTAVKLEDTWKNKYDKKGWIILNVAKTGSIGAPYRITNEQLKQKVIECGNQGMTYNEFRQKFNNIYSSIVRRKLHLPPYNYLDILSNKKRSYTRDEIMDMAKDYKSIAQIAKENPTLYGRIYLKGLVDDVRKLINDPLKDEKYYLEKIKDYNSVKDLRINNRKLYYVIHSRGLLDKVKKYYKSVS